MFPRYYRFGGEPMGWMAQWGGLPPAAARRGERELSGSLGEANFYESAAPGSRRFRPLAKSYRVYRKNPLGHRMILPAPFRVSPSDVLSGDDLVPLRESGPEPLDPGEMPSWQEAYMEDPLAQPVGDLPPLPNYTDVTLGPSSTLTGPEKKPGLLSGFSRNEKILFGAAALVGGFMLLKKAKKGKRGRRR
jgi:hypothetical protein